MKKELFVPMYIDKVKLIDFNSILFDGFNEFTELTVSTDNSNSVKSEAGAGFQLFKIKSGLETGENAENHQVITGNSKYIQTATTMLNKLYEELKESIKKDANELQIGDLVDLDLNFKSNSITEFLGRIKTLVVFAQKTQKFVKDTKPVDFKDTIKIIDQLIEMIDTKDNVVEFVCETEDCIYVTYLKKECLYHTQLERINNQKLSYLAQVVDITDEYYFCADTVLSEFNPTVIEEIIESLKNIGNQEAYSKKFDIVTDNNRKKVIVLDVIGISRKNKN